MKKTLFFAAIAAMFVMASCQKDSENEENQESKSLVFSATIDNGITRTTINTDASSADKGKVSWETTDEITISDGTNSAVYKVKSIDANGKATFAKESGDDLATSGATYKATYGSAPATTQTYSATAGKLPMSATSTTTNLTFTTTCGLLKLNLTDATNTISKVIVSGGTPRASYTLNCENEDISSGKDFYVALPAGGYNHIVCVNSDGAVCSKVATDAITIAANDIQPISFSNMTFDANLLPYEFSVAENKQVMFTNGNLWSDASGNLSFETSQTAYPTSWNTAHVGHFFWTVNKADSYSEDYSWSLTTTSDVPWFASDVAVGSTMGLRALTNEEYNYLIVTRAAAGRTVCKSPVTVDGKANCLIIAPDNLVGGILADNYTEAELKAYGLVCLPAAGCRFVEDSNIKAYGLVCLPAAGTRSASYNGSGISGSYWSATPYTSDAGFAYKLYFDSSHVSRYNSVREYGYSVRLVKTVE